MFLSGASVLFITAVCFISASKADEGVENGAARGDQCRWTGRQCIRNCLGRRDGDYQSCRGCSVYASCVGGRIYDGRACAPATPALQWDDYAKQCLYNSSTCTCYRENNESPKEEVNQMIVAVQDDCKTTGRSCIRNCEGLDDGDYQSCNGCTFYATCVSGHLIDRRPCAAWLQWDDVAKKCVGKTTTCQCKRQTDDDVEAEVDRVDRGDQCRWTGWNCITGCTDLPDGDYQSCRGCSIYVSCVGGKIVDNRSCAPSNPPLQWDDYLKKCEYNSRTCRCYRQSPKVQDRLSWSKILKK